MHNHSRKSSLLLLPLLIFFTGCATILSGKKPILLRTNPPGASYSITDKKGRVVASGKTPSEVTLKPGRGYFAKAEYTVALKMNGYEEKTVKLEYRLNGVYFGNLAFGGLLGMLIVDPLTGAMWTIKNPVVDEELKPKTETGSIQLQILTPNEVPEALKAKMVSIN